MNISAYINGEDEELFEDIEAILEKMKISKSRAIIGGLRDFVIFHNRFGSLIDAMREVYDIPLDFDNEEMVEIPVRIPKSMKQHIDRHLFDCGYNWQSFVPNAFAKFVECKDGNRKIIHKLRENCQTVIS